MARMWIVVGDTTTGDGQVLTGAPRTDIEGKPVARVGDRASCRRHGGDFAIVTGDDTIIIDGQPVARDGDSLACGCRLIAGRQALVHVDQGRSAGDSAPTPVLRSAINLWKPSAPVDALPMNAAPTTAPESEEEGRDGVTLRIGVFFDGTNNNAANVAQGQSCRDSSAQALGQDAETREAIAEHCKPYMLKEGSSYDNGITNIARLFELYRDDLGAPLEAGREEISLRVYVEGIGTRSGEPDQLLSQGFGGGESGVLAKVERAFSDYIPAPLRRWADSKRGKTVEAIEFDVFGFSRGAAAARHFVNQINRKEAGPLRKVLLDSGVFFAPGFTLAENVSVGFVGLFDTVSAIGTLAGGLSVRNNNDGGVRTHLPAGCARKVVQLVARDERRANFMLTTVAPEHEEIQLPGAHSDVGGGYHGDREGPQLMERPVGHIEDSTGLQPGEMPDRLRVERSRAYGSALEACERWKKQLGMDDGALRVDAWHRWQRRRKPGTGSVQSEWVLYIYAAPVLERAVDWRFQLIALRMMHALAVRGGVKFWELSTSTDVVIPVELESIAERLMKKMLLEERDELLLRRRYLHQSSHWNFAKNNAPASLDVIYVNRPDPSGKRGIKLNR